ncbi:MAG: hypothetical protein MRZ79_25435, partial [Bacteroidia bacterium]|nr:hypothetical protein [Bacteroidia bacterium]
DFVNVQLIELWDVNTAEVKNPTAKMGGPSFGIYDFRAGQSSLIQSELQADGHNGYNLGIERLGFSRRQVPSLSSFLPDLQIIKTINHWDEDPVLNPI